MSLASAVIMDGNLARPQGQGDVLNTSEVVQALATAGAGTVTAAMLAANVLNRTGPGGAVADTLPTAAQLINQLLPNAGYVGAGASTPAGVQVGATWRLKYINNVAFALTLTAPDTSVVVTSPTVNASSVKEVLVTIVNGTPQQQIGNCSTTNGSAVVTGMSAAQTSSITPGMLVTGTGIPASATVLSVQPGVGFTLSANATATTNPVALTFSPRYTVLGLGQGLL
jgi:hypothetical protein